MLYYTITTAFFQIFGVLIPCHSRITLHFFSDILLIYDMVIHIHCHITRLRAESWETSLLCDVLSLPLLLLPYYIYQQHCRSRY